MNCINTSSKEYQELLEQSGLHPVILKARISLWQDANSVNEFPKLEDIIQSNEINQTLKAIDILQSDKAKQIFEKGQKYNWNLDKILTELQIPKDQKQLLLDLNISDRTQLALELSSNYGYSIEINTSKQKAKGNIGDIYIDEYGDEMSVSKFHLEKEKLNIPTNYYSELTVPGGTNYTENEISTPLITPSIKGHAQFSTDNGIGWFRSDENSDNKEIRRILEVQSDLFQKGRNKENLASEAQDDLEYLLEEKSQGRITELGEQSIVKLKERVSKENKNPNKFLQLLNKDSNWILFFIKSIIQDSQKKGYEKILFPTGNTASKVEGHETLEGFKRLKEERIKELSDKISNIDNADYRQNNVGYWRSYIPNTEILISQGFAESEKMSKETTLKLKEEFNLEIVRLNQELLNVEREGFASLRPIYNFYENTVTNILKKQGYTPNLITDEYGNTWNEIKLEEERDLSTIYFKQVDSNEILKTLDNIFERSSDITENSNITNIGDIYKILFDNTSKNDYTVDEILENISNNLDEELTSEVREFISKAKKLLKRSPATVKMISAEELDDEGVLMAYNSDSKEILISKSRLANFNSKDGVIAFLHELVHSLTVDAYQKNSKDRSFAEQQLIETVNSFIEKYKDSPLGITYGFTNTAEFIAEFYANPDFRNQVKNTSDSWWKKIMNAIRRLFDLPSNPEYDKLFNTIVNYVEGENLDFSGVNRYGGIYNKKTDNKIELDTISKKVDYALENIKLRVKHAYFKARDSKSKKSKDFSKHLKDLNKELELFKGADKLKGILKYVESFNVTVNIVNNLINKLLKTKDFKYNGVNYNYDENGFLKAVGKNSKPIYHSSLLSSIEDTDFLATIESKVKKGQVIIDNELYDNILKSEKEFKISPEVLYQYQEFLELFDSIKDIDKILNDSKANIKELGVDERLLIENIRKTLDSYRNEYLGIYNTIESLKRNILIDKLSNSVYNTEVETKWRNKLSKEYDSLKIQNEDKDEYISRMLNTKYKDQYLEDLRKSAVDLIENPTIDIGVFDLHATDAFNIKSKFIQIATNMVQDVRNKIISTMKPFDIEISKVHQRFMKNKSGSLSKVFKNVYEQDSKGNYYLARKYSVRFKDSYEKLIKDILSDKDGKLKILNVQKHNLESLKDNRKTISIRKPGEHNYKKDNVLKIVSKGNITGDLVKVKQIHNFSNFDKLSIERKNIFAVLMGDYTDFQDFIDKNDYLDVNSDISKAFPNMYKMIHGEIPMDIIEYELTDDTTPVIDNFIEETEEYKKWIEENTKITKIKGEKYIIPNDSYINEHSKDESSLVEYFSQITRDTNKLTTGKASLIKTSFGIGFYKLPSQTKGDTEYILEGQSKSLIKDKFTDLTQIKAGEVGYEQLDNKGDVRNNIKIHFRNKIDPENQSLDLFTLYRNEKWNGINHDNKKGIENSFKLLIDVIKSKEFIKQNSFGQKLINKYNKNQTPETFDGEFSNELKKVQDIVETNIYDILHKNAGSILGMDTNKLVSTVSGLAAGVAMTGNVPGAVANLTNGYTQLMFQAIGGQNISLKSLAKSERILNSDIFNVIADISKPIKMSYTNQILEMFDVVNNFDQRTQDFIKNTVTKSLLDKRNMNVLSDVGELKMNAMLTMSVLDGLKVMNKNHKFIDKEGNIVSEDKAVTLLDMIYKNDDGLLIIDKKVSYTSHNLVNDIHSSGKIHISNLIKKKGFDMFGVYSPEFAAKMSKTFWGKSLLMFKKYLLPGLKSRYRGIGSAHKLTNELEEDELFYSSAEKEYIEGYYVTFIRGLIQVVKNRSLKYTQEYFNSLTDYEKANLKKATIELVTTMIFLPLMGMLLSAAADGDDDELTYFLAYQVRRLESEISSFRNPNEAYKVLNNPLASVRFIQNSTKVLQDVITPINFNPEGNEEFLDYLSKNSKDENLLIKHTLKTVPLLNQFDRSYKDMLNFIENKSVY